MGASIAKIGGCSIQGSAPVRWEFTDGFEPVVETFDVLPADADRLTKGNRTPVALEMRTGDKIVKVENLWVLRRAPGESPKQARIVVADRRWFWPYRLVVGRYNIRQKVGVKRISSPSTPLETADISDDVQYASWSLRVDGSGLAARWKPGEMLKDVIDKLTFAEWNNPGYEIDQAVGTELDELVIEDLSINTSGNHALSQALAFLPEAAVTITAEGKIRIYSRVDGGEKAVIGKLGPEMVGRGHIEVISGNLTCPKKVNVYFVREQEVRFDAIEALSATANTGVVVPDRRHMENVLPVPDYTIPINGKWVCQGTWVTFDEYLEAISSIPIPGAHIPKLDHSFLQKAFMPYLDLWGALQLLGVRDPDVDWIARIAAMAAHYRRTYRINPKWRKRFFRFYAYRVATIDPQHGTRAPSEVYADYAYLGGQRYWWKQIAEKPETGIADLSYATNVAGYPQGATMSDGKSKKFTDTSKAAPARVQILDHDQGIIQFDYQLDPVKLFDRILPSQVNDGPTGDVTQRTRSIAFNAVIKGAENAVPKLKAEHRACVIMTAVPACPNSLAQYYKVSVEPSQVTKLLPVALLSSLMDAKGPKMDVFIGPGIETARFAWSDDRETDIGGMFGVDMPNVPPGTPANDVGLVINDSQDASGAASLQAIARAAAARIYGMYAVHAAGSATGILNGAVTLAGFLSRVAHEIDQEGVASTRIEAAESLPALDWQAFLPASTRAIIDRQVQ